MALLQDQPREVLVDPAARLRVDAGHPAARDAITRAAALEQTLVQSGRKGLAAIGPAGSKTENLEISKPHGLLTDVRGGTDGREPRRSGEPCACPGALRSARPERLHPFYCPLLRRGNLVAAHQRFRVF